MPMTDAEYRALLDRTVRRPNQQPAGGSLPEPEAPGFMGRLANTMGNTLGGLGANIGRGVGEAAGDYLGWEDWRERARERSRAEEQHQRRPEAQGASRSWDNPVERVAGDVAGALATLPFSAHPVTAMLNIPGFAGSNIEQQERDAEAEATRRGVPFDRAAWRANLGYAYGAALPQAAMESFLGPERILRGALPMATRNQGFLARLGIGAGTTAVSEGMTEGAQEFLEIAQGAMAQREDPNAHIWTGATRDRVLDAAISGAIGGGVLGGGLSALAPAPTTLEQAQARAVELYPGQALPMPQMPGQAEPSDPVTGLPGGGLAEEAPGSPGTLPAAPGGVLPVQPVVAQGVTPVTPAAVSPIDAAVAGMRPAQEQARIEPVQQAEVPVQAEPEPQAAPEAAPLEQPAYDPLAGLSGKDRAQAAKKRERAQRSVQSFLGSLQAYGPQGKAAADAAAAKLTEGLEQGTVDVQGAQFIMGTAHTLATQMPGGAGYAVNFVNELVGRKSGASIQGRVTETRNYDPETRKALTDEGLAGIVEYGLRPEDMAFGKETAAHEGFHIVQNILRDTDPKMRERLDAAFPAGEGGYFHLNDADAAILRLLRNGRIRREGPDKGKTYLDYLNEQQYNDRNGNPMPMGAQQSAEEIQAVVYGALHAIKKDGRSLIGLPDGLKALLNVGSVIRRAMRRPDALEFMRDVQSGAYKRQMDKTGFRPRAGEDDDERDQGRPDASSGVEEGGQRPDAGGQVPGVDREEPAAAGELRGQGGLRGSPGVVSVQGEPNAQEQRSERVGKTKKGRIVWQVYDPASQAEEPLPGTPRQFRINNTPVAWDIPGQSKWGAVFRISPNATARKAADDYMRSAGMEYRKPPSYQIADPARGARIADAFEAMKDDPYNPLVRDAYQQMATETMAQWKVIEAAGLKAEFYPLDGGDPYNDTPWNAHLDVALHNHMYVFPTEFGYSTDETGKPVIPDADRSNNPLLADTGIKWDGRTVLMNDLFRAVHDYFGHIKDGFGFRADGEENAWRSHAAMYSPLARMAMTSETRGQNSWLNFGPFGQQNKAAKTGKTVFAAQKIGVLPQWALREGAENYIDELPAEIAKRHDRDIGQEAARLDRKYGYVTQDFTKQPVNMLYGAPGKKITAEMGMAPGSEKPFLNTAILSQASMTLGGNSKSDGAVHIADGAVHIAVDKDGNGFIVSGGNDLKQAIERKKQHIKTTLTYYDGGQNKNKLFHPTRMVLAARNEAATPDGDIFADRDALASAGAVINAVRDLKYNAVNIIANKEFPKTPPPGLHNTMGASLMLQGRVRTHYDIKDSIEDRERGSLEQHEFDRMVRNMAWEFMTAVREQTKGDPTNQGNDWYDKSIRRALGVFAVKHPELLDGEAAVAAGFGREPAEAAANARTIMMAGLAITSQGTSVEQQTPHALRIYEQVKKDLAAGKGIAFDTKDVGTGNSTEAIKGNFEKFNDLLREMPGETSSDKLGFLRRFLNTQFITDDLAKKYPNMLAGHLRHDPFVHGSSLFGPKIGGGFYQNLVGNFDPLTVDIWFVRTFNRHYGHLIGDKAKYPVHLNRLRESYAEAVANARVAAGPDGAKNIRAREVTREKAIERLEESSRELTTALELRQAEQDKLLAQVKKDVKTPKELAAQIHQGRKTIAEIKRTLRENDAEIKANYVELASLRNYPPTGMSFPADLKPIDAAIRANELANEWLSIFKTRRLTYMKKHLMARGYDAATAEKIAKTTDKKKLATDDQRNDRAELMTQYAKAYKAGGEFEHVKPAWAYSANALKASQRDPFGMPSNAEERRLMGRITRTVVDLVNKASGKKTGEPGAATSASVQAVLWYMEKELWARSVGDAANAEYAGVHDPAEGKIGYDDADPVNSLMAIDHTLPRGSMSNLDILNKNYEVVARKLINPPEGDALTSSAIENQINEKIAMAEEALLAREVLSKDEIEDFIGKQEGQASYDDNINDSGAKEDVADNESARVTRDYFRLKSDFELGSKGYPKGGFGRARADIALESMPNEMLGVMREGENAFMDRLRSVQTEPKGRFLAHDLLDSIEKSYKSSPYGGYMTELVNRLKAGMPKTMPVYTWDFQGQPTYSNGRDPGFDVESYREQGSSYVYDIDMEGDHGLILLTPGKSMFAGTMHNTFLHEAVHAATVHKVRRIYGNRHMNREMIRAIDGLRTAMYDHMADNEMLYNPVNYAGGPAIYYTHGVDPTDPGYRPKPEEGAFEFFAESLSSPYFQRLLATAKITPELRRLFKEAGIEIKDEGNLFHAVIAAIKKFLNINPGNTLFDATMAISNRVMNEPVHVSDVDASNAMADVESARLPKEVNDVLNRVVHNPGASGFLGRSLNSKPWKKPMRSKLRGAFRAWAIDRYSALEDDERLHNNGVRLAAEQSGFVAMWQADDADAMVERMISTDGSLELVQDKKNPRISHWQVKSNDKAAGMGWLTDFIGKATDADDAKARMKAFQAYALVERGLNLTARGTGVPFTAADRAAQRAAVAKYPDLKKAYDGYQRFNKNLMDQVVKAGVITQAEAAEFMKHNDYYPYYRVIATSGLPGSKRVAGIGARFAPHELVGGMDPFESNPLTAITNNIAYWTHASMRNVAKQKVVATGLKTGNIVAREPQGGEAAINVLVNGKRFVFAAKDPLMASAMESFWALPEEWHRFVSFFGWPARFLRNIVTKSPTFMLYNNLIRDSVSGWQVSGSNFTPIAGTYKGLVDFYRNDADVKKYLSLGHSGGMRYQDSFFRDAGDLMLRDIMIEKGVRRASTPGQLLDILQVGYAKLNKLSDASDAATRIAIFKAEKAKPGVSDMEAAWRAREIMNFNKRGSSTIIKVVSSLIPFTNSRIQGLDTTYQSLKGAVGGNARVGDVNETRGEKMAKFAVRAAMLTSIAMMLEMAFGDDDEIKDQPAWLRNSHLLVPMSALGFGDIGLLAIPKPFEFGTMFMTIPQQAYRVIMGQETLKRFVSDLPSTALSGMAYTPVPTAVLPIVEGYLNFNFFTGRPVTGRSMENLPSHLQFTRRTAGIYKDAADSMAAAFRGMGLQPPSWLPSPIAMQHFVNAYTGSLGAFTAGAIGNMIGAEELNSFSWREMPILGGMFRDPKRTQSAGTDSLYQLLEQSNRLAGELRHYRRLGDFATAREVTEVNRDLNSARSNLTQLKARQDQMVAQQRKIMRDTRIPIEDRRQRLEQIDQQIREHGRRVEALRLRLGL